MSEQQFDIIFRGDIVFGHQLGEVKVRLQQLFKADAAKIDALFTGRPVPLKRGLDQASAQKYKDVLIKAGAQVELVAAASAESASPQPAKPTATPAAAPQSAASMTLAQRLAQQEAESAQKAEAARKAQADADARTAEIATRQQSSSQTVAGDWSLSPAGADLLKPTEKHEFVPRDIDTSALSLRASSGNLVDASEQPQVAIKPIAVPSYQVAEVGANLVDDNERLDLPLPEIELEDWTIAEAGADIIDESEKAIQPVAVINAIDVGLAPVGADLGQLKPQVKPVVPDISGIKLADS